MVGRLSVKLYIQSRYGWRGGMPLFYCAGVVHFALKLFVAATAFYGHFLSAVGNIALRALRCALWGNLLYLQALVLC